MFNDAFPFGILGNVMWLAGMNINEIAQYDWHEMEGLSARNQRPPFLSLNKEPLQVVSGTVCYNEVIQFTDMRSVRNSDWMLNESSDAILAFWLACVKSLFVKNNIPPMIFSIPNK